MCDEYQEVRSGTMPGFRNRSLFLKEEKRDS